MDGAMNTRLIEYGIFQENSNIRCHVAPGTKRIFIYRTDYMVNLISNNKYRTASAKQGNIITATGFLVPLKDIPDLRRLQWDYVPWWDWFRENMNPTEKGSAAVKVAKKIIELGRFPFWFIESEDSNVEIDIAGTDMILKGTSRIQVKCDWRAGEKIEGGSGNIYVQTHECNPFGYH